MNATRHYGRHDGRISLNPDARYALLAALYTGTWHAVNEQLAPAVPGTTVPQSLYKNSRQIVKLTGAIVDLYEQLVWQGDLSTDGQPLPDGTRGAIPIDPQTGNEASDARLVVAFHELFKMWQWRAQMSLVPKTAAIFGDVLVELRDFPLRGEVQPDIIYPGYVPDDDLDLDGVHVKRYAVEYPVTITASTAFGEDVKAEQYVFRKEVDGQTFRFYKDGKPFAYEGIGPAEQPNPYGFAPAALFRHETVVSSNRGLGAYEKTALQMADLNSTLSSAIDYQRKQFGAPIGVKGSVLRPGRTVSMGPLHLTTPSTPDDMEAARRAAAENLGMLPLSDTGAFVTIQFDLGQTMDMGRFVYESLIAENPEATWASKLFGLTQATGPGMQRILAPIIGKVEGVRKNDDPQMIKLLQMATSMMAYRLQAGDIPEAIVKARPDRYAAFAAFDMSSWGRGLLDATIPGRPVFTESLAEKAQWLVLAADLPAWGLREMGVDEEEIATILADREAAQERFDTQLTGIGGDGDDEAEEA